MILWRCSPNGNHNEITLGVHCGEASKMRRRSMWLILGNAKTIGTPSPRG
jgi:hypothetical protein